MREYLVIRRLFFTSWLEQRVGVGHREGQDLKHEAKKFRLYSLSQHSSKNFLGSANPQFVSPNQ